MNGKCQAPVVCQDREIFNGFSCIPLLPCCEKGRLNTASGAVECYWPMKGYTLDMNGGCVQPMRYASACAPNQYEGVEECINCSEKDYNCVSCGLSATLDFVCKKCFNDLEIDASTGFCKSDNPCHLG